MNTVLSFHYFGFILKSLYFSVCNRALDIGLIIDTSGSINEGDIPNWPIVVRFLTDLVNQLNIGFDMVRVGAVQFSQNASLEWRLDSYFDRVSMIDAINRIFYQGQTTNLAGGLELARNAIFNDPGNRQGVRNVALVITDGVPNVRFDDTIPEARALARVVDLIVAVGVTDRVDFDLLGRVASSPSNVISVRDFSALTNDLDRIVTEVCLTTDRPFPPPVPVPTPAPPTG